MNLRQQIMAWGITLCLVLALTLVPMVAFAPPAAPRRTDVVVIGSSQMAYAVPALGGGSTSLLGDGRSHHRIATPRMSERDVLAQMDKALDQRAQFIFVEANVFLFDFADQPRTGPCSGWTYEVRNFLVKQQRELHDTYRVLLGLRTRDIYIGDPQNIASRQVIDRAAVRQQYPLIFRAPCEVPRLAASITRAKQQGTRIIFILPPRSPYADAILGTAVRSAIAVRARKLTMQVGAELFAPASRWSNDEFVDHGHLNQIGRRHFLAELRHWWAVAR